jgi:glycosyltransferase involved in cell wall biosynthesis
MNILNVVYTFNPGGVERLVIDVSNQMIKQEHNAFVCIVSEEYSDSLVSQFDEKVKLFFLKKANQRRHMSYLMQLNKIIRENRIQAMHVHQGTLMNFFLLVKTMNPALRIYFTVHDTYIFTKLSLQNQLISRLICKKFVAISDAVKANILKNGVKQEKILRVYNGINFERFDVKKHHKAEQTIVITNVARFFPEKKGQDVLIKAVAILKEKGYNIKVMFAGAPSTEDGGALDDMHNLSCELNVEKNINLLGNVDNVPKLLEQTDIFVIPSRYEGFGIAAVEALAMGIPCVASDIEGLNEVVNSSELGEVFTAGNERELAQKLQYIINHLSDYKPDVIAENAKSRFSIESMTKKLLSVYYS